MRLNFDKLLSQEATDTHLVRNILKLSDNVGRDSTKSHSAMNSNILNIDLSLTYFRSIPAAIICLLCLGISNKGSSLDISSYKMINFETEICSSSNVAHSMLFVCIDSNMVATSLIASEVQYGSDQYIQASVS